MRYLTLGTYPQLEIRTLDNLTAEYTVEVITKDVSCSNVPAPTNIQNLGIFPQNYFKGKYETLQTF